MINLLPYETVLGQSGVEVCHDAVQPVLEEDDLLAHVALLTEGGAARVVAAAGLGFLRGS